MGITFKGGLTLPTSSKIGIANFDKIASQATPTPPAFTFGGTILDPATNNGAILSNGNLTAFGAPGAWKEVWANASITSGKWYWEITIDIAGSMVFGVATTSHTMAFPGNDNASWGAYVTIGQALHNGISTAFPIPATSGQVIGIALDADIGTISYYDVSGLFGTPFSGVTGTLYPSFAIADNTTITVNFGATSFAYGVPAGYNQF